MQVLHAPTGLQHIAAAVAAGHIGALEVDTCAAQSIGSLLFILHMPVTVAGLRQLCVCTARCTARLSLAPETSARWGSLTPLSCC